VQSLPSFGIYQATALLRVETKITELERLRKSLRKKLKKV